MAEGTEIAWATDTFNPWEGCEKVSAGCKFCYAEARNIRFSGGEHWGKDAPRLMRSPAYWNAPRRWNKEAASSGGQRRVFCGSLCDVAEDRPDLVEPRARLERLIEETPALTWLLVTKRPQNYRRLFPWERWPANVWAGTTVEDQEQADLRIPHLIDVPACVRFLSVEPLLERVDLTMALEHFQPLNADLSRRPSPIDWVIVGGESAQRGQRARPCAVAWIRDIVAQCRKAGSAVFVKQLGDAPVGVAPLRASKGGDLAEWPADLCVREFPR